VLSTTIQYIKIWYFFIDLFFRWTYFPRPIFCRIFFSVLFYLLPVYMGAHWVEGCVKRGTCPNWKKILFTFVHWNNLKHLCRLRFENFFILPALRILPMGAHASIYSTKYIITAYLYSQILGYIIFVGMNTKLYKTELITFIR